MTEHHSTHVPLALGFALAFGFVVITGAGDSPVIRWEKRIFKKSDAQWIGIVCASKPSNHTRFVHDSDSFKLAATYQRIRGIQHNRRTDTLPSKIFCWHCTKIDTDLVVFLCHCPYSCPWSWPRVEGNLLFKFKKHIHFTNLDMCYIIRITCPIVTTLTDASTLEASLTVAERAFNIPWFLLDIAPGKTFFARFLFDLRYTRDIFRRCSRFCGTKMSGKVRKLYIAIALGAQ